ncbi:glycosyltransferase [Photobacterium damselae]|uniref:glycosyltransferase n=1 Tax=Photobacterium damselae TaxID=38293 RepID=UPI00165DE6BC|nr:glycosyltransferase [Photobacterium damselae]
MKISIVSFSDLNGGAARAAYRLHKALCVTEMKSQMLVKHKSSDDYTVLSPTGAKQIYSKFINFVSRSIQKSQITNNPILHSSNFFGSSVFELVQKSDADLINLHWINGETISIRQISKINKSVVLTLHDMWAFCGTEHYCEDNLNSRFRVGYSKKNKIDIIAGIDLNRFIWMLKKRYWKSKKFTIVTPSCWLSQCAMDSLLFKHCEIYTIPNALDIDVFKPVDKNLAKTLLNLPLDKKLIGFGAMGGRDDPRKGYDLLEDALKELSVNENYQCIVFGQSTPETTPNLGLPVKFIGHLNDDVTLTLFYNAIDVMVVPSKQEAFGQTASEAQACGTPVVAFNTTGLIDVVEHKVTGYLAEPFNVNDLANGIEWVLLNTNSNKFTQNCRRRAIRLWSYDAVSLKYKELFEAIKG